MGAPSCGGGSDIRGRGPGCGGRKPLGFPRTPSPGLGEVRERTGAVGKHEPIAGEEASFHRQPVGSTPTVIEGRCVFVGPLRPLGRTVVFALHNVMYALHFTSSWHRCLATDCARTIHFLDIFRADTCSQPAGPPIVKSSPSAFYRPTEPRPAPTCPSNPTRSQVPHGPPGPRWSIRPAASAVTPAPPRASPRMKSRCPSHGLM